MSRLFQPKPPADTRRGIHRALDPWAATAVHLSVDPGRLHLTVAEEFLHGSYPVARFQQMSGEAMPERVAGGMLQDARASHRRLHGPLDYGFVDMLVLLLPGPGSHPAMPLARIIREYSSRTMRA